MRPLAPLLAAILLALISLPGPAFGYTYGDTLTTIWRPLPNLPALARPGDAFTVWANAPASAANWAASLRFGGLVVPLQPSGGGWQAAKARWELSFTVPAGTPEEIYALILTSDSTLPDSANHSVKVLPGYRSDYYFAQISDTHLPEHTFSTSSGINTADTSGMGDFDAVIEDLNVIHPEFIIHTGDLVNEGELEEYLGMFEMGRAQGMLGRLRDPVWVSSGNHDIGGWGATPPPDGTSRKDWWRYFGWNFLGNPPAGDPSHSQDFTFDYGPLHVIGLEAYINNGSYDHYMQNIWGAQSFTAEQMTWLQNDIAAQPPGTHKLLFYHYDFGGTLANGTPAANFTQINPGALGIDGAIWGHNHGVAEGSITPLPPFNLGLQSVIDNRAFRIFRVHDGAMTPGATHHAGGNARVPTDSMTVTWNAANDGSRSALGVTVFNRYGETWDHARLVFNMADHDSAYTAVGGTIAQTIRQSGMVNVYVDAVIPAGGTQVVSVQASAPLAGVGPGSTAVFGVRALGPNPFHAGSGERLDVHFALTGPGPARLEVLDVDGRRVATLEQGPLAGGAHEARWNGVQENGGQAAPGLYFIRLVAGPRSQTARFALLR